MTRLSLWRYLIVKIGRWKFLETATWLKGNRYLQGSKESLNIDEEESSKNAGRRRVSKERKDTRGEKKERKPKEGPGYCLFFFTLLSPSVPRRYRQRSALWKFLAGSPLLFSLCYRIMLEARRREKKMILGSRLRYLFFDILRKIQDFLAILLLYSTDEYLIDANIS